MNRKHLRLLFTLSLVVIFSSILIVNRRSDFSLEHHIERLIDHHRPNNFSSLYENFVLLSCSSDSYTSIYCYYLPYVALAWRRLGFEPVVFLVGSKKKFQEMPLMKLLEDDLRIRYHFVSIDPARSIATSQIIRLFAGFMSYENRTNQNSFILIADVDLIPVTRRRFIVESNQANYILAVNAFCCPADRFTYQNLTNIHYYPISYVGMNRDLWKKIFFPLDRCSLSSNLTIDFIECALKEKMNASIPTSVIKGGPYWDLDQKLLSVLIARAKYSSNVFVDKRERGSRLDPDKRYLASEFRHILSYEDVHLPNRNETLLYTYETWQVLREAFSNLFHNETIQLLARYHFQTAASILTVNRTAHV